MKQNYVGKQMHKYYSTLAQKTDRYYYDKAIHEPIKQLPTQLDIEQQQQQELIQSIQEAHHFTSNEATKHHMNLQEFLQKTSSPNLKFNPRDMLKDMKSMEKTQTEITLEEVQKEDIIQQKELELQQLQNIEEVKKSSVVFGTNLTEKEKFSLVAQQQQLNIQDDRLNNTTQSLSQYIDPQYIVASFLDLKQSSLYLHYQQLMQLVDFLNKFMISQEFYEFIQSNTQKCDYNTCLNVLIQNWSQKLMQNLTILITQKIASLPFELILKRPKSYLQSLIGSNQAFVQFAVSYLLAKLSNFNIYPDPYARFPILSQNASENLLVSIF